jgi:tetratricopeptide (TPR) repeat protein
VASQAAPAGITPGSSRNEGRAAREPLSPEGEAALQEGAALLQQGRVPQAAEAFARAVRTDPQSGLAHDYRGIASLQQGQFEEALREFRQAARLQPDSAVPWARIADVHLARGDIKHAVQALERAVRIEPDRAQLHFNLGALYPRYLQLAKGIASFRRCVELEPQNHPARAALAELLTDTKQLDEAEAEIERAIALQPNDGAYHFTLGRVLLQRRAAPENSRRALAAFDQAIALGVDRPALVHYHRGLCLQRLERWEESVDALQKSVALEPDGRSAYHALASSLARLRRLPEARAARARFQELQEPANRQRRRAFYEEEVARNRDDPDAYFQLGVFLEGEGDSPGALRALQQAAELAEKRDTPAERRLRIHRRLEALYRRNGLRREADAERAALRRLERGAAGTGRR